MAFDLKLVDVNSIGETNDEERQRDRVSSNLSEAVKINADEHAEAQQLSTQTGVPQFAVDDSTKQKFNLDKIDVDGIYERSPKTANYLSDFDNTVIAQDDVPVMQAIEEVFNFDKTFENISETIGLGFESQAAGMGLAGADLIPERREDLIPMGAMPIGMESEARMLSLEYAENFGIKSDEELQQVKDEGVNKMIADLRALHEKRAKLAPEDLNLLEQGVRAGVESLANMAPGFGLMLVTGGRAAPMLMTMGVQTYGESYGQGRSEGLTQDEATWFASINAAIEVGTEMLPTGTIEKILTGKSTGLKKAALKFIVQEMGTEQLATLGQSINEYSFGLDKQMENATSIEEMIDIQLQRQAVTAIATVVAGGAQVTAATGIRKGIESLTQDIKKKETKGEVEQRKIDTLNEQSEKSKLRERDKESFKQFVQEADSENNTTVFIDSAQASLYMQSKTPDEIKADPALQILSEQTTEAAKNGVDIQIPVADFATDFAGTEHFEQLRDSMTMSAETTAPFRQEQVKKETESYIQRMMDEFDTNTSEYAQAQEIYTQVREQLIDTGTVTPANASVMAQVVPAWATAQAKRSGKSVEQVYRDSGLVIEGPQTGERARQEGEIFQQTEEAGFKGGMILEGDMILEQAEEAGFKGESVIEAIDFLEQKGIDIATPEQVDTVEQRATIQEEGVVRQRRNLSGSKARELFDKMNREELINELLKHELTGIKGRKAFVADVQDAAVVASIDADSLKWINDNLSPDHGDTLLQAVADALENETEGAYHISGDEFYVLGETQEEVQGIVDKAIDKLSSSVITATKPDGTVITLNGLNITVGVGETKDAADQKLKTEKVRREETGERASRGEQPLGSTIRSPEGFDPDSNVSEQVEGVFRQDSIDLLGGNLDESGKYTETPRDVQPADEVRDRAIITGRETIKQVEVGFETLDTSAKVALATISLSKSPQEKFWAVTLDKDNKPLAILNHTIGVKDAASVDPAAVAGWAVSVEGATQVYFSHNHPSDISVLSSADKTTSAKIKNLLDGSGVESKGIMAVTPTEFTHEDGTSGFIPKTGTSNKVDLVERTLERLSTKNKKAITSPDIAKSIIEELSQGDDGVLLLNTKHVPIGFLPFDFEKHGGQLRGGKLTTLLKAVESTNASAVMLNTTKLDVNERNVANMLAAADMRVLDAFVHGLSAIEMGWTISTGTTFKQEARGYYDPANSVIRLTKAADLSTFLHEFAHFMYEMEVNGNTEMLQSINSWYKRNAEYVAKEANDYLGEEFDVLKQNIDSESITFNPESIEKILNKNNVDIGLKVGKKAKFWRAVGATSGGNSATYGTGLYVAGSKADAKEYLGEGGRIIEMDHSDLPSNPLRFTTIIEYQNWLQRAQKELGYTDVREFRKQFDDIRLFVQALDPELNGIQISTGKDALFVNYEGRKVFKQPIDQPTATEGSITPEDVVAFLDNNTVGDKAKDAAIRRALHEQFARGFETYLMEGKAPSIELRNAFRTFARWLSRIYQSLRGQLNVNLDAEMRAVFDRLVATEDQIAAAEGRAQVEPMFTDAAMAGMTEEQFIKYQQQQEKVKDIQSETLRDKLIKQLTRQTTEWWNEERSDIIDEEIDVLKKERVYAAREKLKTDELKIDHATIKEMAGIEKTDKIGRKSVVIPPSLIGMTAKGQKGIHPDEAAAFLGYNSGSEMIEELMTAPPIKDQAEINANVTMIERHGDILTDGTIEQQADEAVQNEERGKLILAELKALAKGTNAPVIDRVTIKEVAITNIGKLAFREIHPAKYRRAEIRAAQEAATMLSEGNKEGAAAAKMRQVMNYYLGMEAMNAKNNTTKIVDRMSRYNKKKVRQEILKAENGYLDQIDKILNRFEFRKGATLKQVESINLWMKERTETDGDGLVLSNAVLNESYVTHWKNIPFSDLQGVNDSVKNIEHVARYANKIKLQQEEIDFKKLKGQWVDHINEQDKRFDTKASRSRMADSRKANAMEHVRKWASQLTKVPYLASWLDGGERAGLSHDILVQPFTDALDLKMKLVDEVATPVLEAIINRSKVDQKRHNTKIWIPEIDDHLMGHQILAVALNTGNQGNLKKLLLGEGWADPEVDTDISTDNPQLQAVLAHMTKSDWELVQNIWDQMDILYPQLAEVHRKTTGLTPSKVEATPITNEFGTFRGGYYPVKYSPKRSHKAEKNAEKREAETESMFNNTASIQASVNAGATNERTGFYDRINLSLEVVPDHFNETIHYITHHDAVRQVNRLIQAPDVADAITGVLGEEEFRQLKPWLNDIAKDGRQQPVKTYIDIIFQRLRFGTTLGVMGFKASTGIMQVYGLLTTAAELGVGPTVKGVYTTIGRSWYMKSVRNLLGSTDDMQTGWEFASEKSKVMNHRVKTMDREIRNAMESLRGKRGLMAAVQEASMKHIALIQTYLVDLPTWHAAYSKELSESSDEGKAINRADWSVENLQGSGATKDMATILRSQSKLHSTMTMFMTFFSSLGNLSRDLVKGNRSGLYSNTSTAAKLMFLFTLPVFFEMLMRGELDEPDDEDKRMNKFLTNVALYPLNSVPFVRDAASGLIGDYGYNSSPVASVIEKGISGYKQITERAFTDDEVTKSAKKNASKLTGVLLGIPGISQIWATGEHLYDVIENGEDFTVRELLFGPKR